MYGRACVWVVLHIPRYMRLEGTSYAHCFNGYYIHHAYVCVYASAGEDSRTPSKGGVYVCLQCIYSCTRVAMYFYYNGSYACIRTTHSRRGLALLTPSKGGCMYACLQCIYVRCLRINSVHVCTACASYTHIWKHMPSKGGVYVCICARSRL